MRKEALDAMMPFFLEEYANPSSIHGMSRTPRAAIQKARGQIAECLNADPKEIFFTSGGTESDNWALIGTMEMLESKGKHLIVSACAAAAGAVYISLMLDMMAALQACSTEMPRVSA